MQHPKSDDGPLAGQSRTISVGEEPLGEDRCGPVPIHAPTPHPERTKSIVRQRNRGAREREPQRPLTQTSVSSTRQDLLVGLR